MNPSVIGARAEAAVLAALVDSGRTVLLPFSAHERYDLVFEEGGRFYRVQCKTGRLRNGAIRFRTHSTTAGRLTHYVDEIDYFGVYCPETGQTYLVPVGEVPVRGAHLRTEPARNGQGTGIRWAAHYALKP